MTTTQRVINLATVAAISFLALMPLASAYRSLDFWVASVGGVLLGLAIALIGTMLRWRTLSIFAALVVVFFLFGGVLVFRHSALLGFLPTFEVLSSLALGAVRVWKQALTLQTPFIGFAELSVAPYFVTLLTTTLAASFALRLRRFALALIPLAALLLFSVFYSAYNPTLPAVVGAAIAGIALAWSVWRLRLGRLAAHADHAPGEDDGTPLPAASPLQASAPVAAVLVGAIALSAVGAAAVPADRYTVRDHVRPPLELHDYATPLASFRKWVTDGDEAQLFTVQGLPEGATIRLAALDLYDGIVYRVSGAGGEGSGQFTRVGREIEPPTEGEHASVTIEVGDIAGVWVPTTGSLSSLRLISEGAASRSADLHYNTATGTAVLTSGLQPGDRYVFEAVLPARPDEQQLAKAKVAQVNTPKPEQVPDVLISALDEIIVDASTPAEQVRAVEAYLQSSGFFSHGLEGQVLSRSGHGVGREAELFTGEQMVGDDEQYSVAMALMLSQLGIPVRVVMGFSGEGGAGLADTESVAVNGEHLHAWVEVPFEGLGWVAFWPTPAEDRTPLEEVPEQRQKPRAQVAQPPDTPQEPAELPPAPPVEDGEEEEQGLNLAWLWQTLRIAAVSLLVLMLLLGPSLLLAVLKARQRKRRAGDADPATRAHGGWAELVDTATDVGAPLSAGATRREQGAALDADYPEAGTLAIATRADAAVFGASAPDQHTVEQIWQESEAAQKHILRAQPWHRRLRARLFPRSAVRTLGERVRGTRGTLRQRFIRGRK